MKYKSKAIVNELIALIEPSKHYIIIGSTPDLSHIKDKQLRDALLQVRNTIRGAMRAFFQIEQIYEDVIVCHKMLGSYPWKRNRITRSQHLHFVWAQFTNLCYLFEERYKLASNCQRTTMKIFNKDGPEKTSQGLGRIRKALGTHIRQRGQHTHEWSTSNPHAQDFATIELINSEKRIDGPLGNVEGHFRLTRMLMRWEIEAAIKFMEEFLLAMLLKEVSKLSECTTRFNQLVEKADTTAVTMKGSTINFTIPG